MILVVDSTQLQKDLWLTKEAIEHFDNIYVGAFKDWEDLMVYMEFFPSRGQARKAGRTGPLPTTNGWQRVGRRQFYFLPAHVTSSHIP